jgi:Flp pilus assembly protein CpaB
MQGAPVLAVGKVFSVQPAKADAPAFADSSEGTVTLAASPFEAEQLTHLEQTGRIKLVLRAPGDRERIPLPAITGRVIKPAAVADDEPVRKR